jgi:hypothetical protein
MGPLSPAIAEDGRELRGAIQEVLREAGGPVELLALVDSLAEAVGLAEDPFVPAETLAGMGVRDDPVERLMGRQYLQRLWSEIVALPLRQRRALLLQLRLDEEESAARVLAALGIASFAALEEALGMTRAELIRVWNRLPLPDQDIALLLAATRQQVINLRKSARERLARRLGRPR